MKKTTFKRLSKDVIPVEYTIMLKPDLEAHVFEGEETVTLSVIKPTRTITLHSKDLEIIFAECKKSNIAIAIARTTYDEKAETVTFHFTKSLAKGTHSLKLVFRGILSDSMRGFYKSQYTIDGKTHTMATTQFEATDARRCIPCFDEPAHKAVFNVHLVVPTNKEAISNTLPIAVNEHEAGYKIVSFAPTPKMSTYLLAFVIGDLEYIEAKTKRGVKVRVFTVPGKKEQGRFALDVAVKCIDFYESYFAIPYPLPVLDMIAIPDFESGAMENWGAVTYRETALLVDDAHTSLRAKQYVAIVVAHELAHQWFGNLVTMEWWTHLWLNEGFASYIEYLAVHELFPQWQIWDQFIVEDHNTALSLDALSNTHPVEVPIHHPGEISEIFDKISYSKGASIIRMLANYIGETAFRDGLRYYLKKHSYKNTETVHLWEAFEKVSKKPITKLMARFTLQPGFPVISVSQNKQAITFSQERFILGTAKGKESWLVPVTYTLSEKKKDTFLLASKTQKIVVAGSFDYLKINPYELSFFITSYSPELLERLYEPVLRQSFGSIDRLAIIRDLHYILLAGRLEPAIVLNFLTAYRNEEAYVVWVEITAVISTLRKILYGTASYPLFETYVQACIGPLFKKLGYVKIRGESNLDVLLRGMILSLSSLYNLPTARAQAVTLFKERAAKPLDPDVRSFVYSTLGRIGKKSDYETLLALFRKEELHEEKNRLLAGLCMFSNPVLLKKTLSLIHTKEVRLQDRFRANAVLLYNRETQIEMWEYLKIHWNDILATYGETSHSLSRIVEYLDACVDEKMAKDIEKFFVKRAYPGIKRTLQQTLEKIALHLALKKKHQKAIGIWFQKNSFKK
jgi:puromycin-sensitive aminopeptidase